MDLKKVSQLISDLKSEKIQMAKDHTKQVERLNYLVSGLGKRNPGDLKDMEANYKAMKRARKEEVL